MVTIGDVQKVTSAIHHSQWTLEGIVEGNMDVVDRVKVDAEWSREVNRCIADWAGERNLDECSNAEDGTAEGLHSGRLKQLRGWSDDFPNTKTDQKGQGGRLYHGNRTCT